MMRLPLLVRVLRDPAAVRGLDGVGWDLLLRQADAANLDAFLLVLLEDAGLLDAVPAGPARTWSGRARARPAMRGPRATRCARSARRWMGWACR